MVEYDDMVQKVMGDVRSEFVDNCRRLNANILVGLTNVERMQNKLSGIRKKYLTWRDSQSENT